LCFSCSGSSLWCGFWGGGSVDNWGLSSWFGLLHWYSGGFFNWGSSFLNWSGLFDWGRFFNWGGFLLWGGNLLNWSLFLNDGVFNRVFGTWGSIFDLIFNWHWWELFHSSFFHSSLFHWGFNSSIWGKIHWNLRDWY
jgi:hypothetical protein